MEDYLTQPCYWFISRSYTFAVLKNSFSWNSDHGYFFFFVGCMSLYTWLCPRGHGHDVRTTHDSVTLWLGRLKRMHVHHTAHGKSGARAAGCRRLHLHRLAKRTLCTADAPCKVPPSWLEKGRTCGSLGCGAGGSLVRSVSHHMRVWRDIPA